jgi:hypothetical protein
MGVNNTQEIAEKEQYSVKDIEAALNKVRHDAEELFFGGGDHIL